MPTTYPCCQEVTQSCVGINPFLPTPAAAILSKLSDVSKELDRTRSLIFPLDFSDWVDDPTSVSEASLSWVFKAFSVSESLLSLFAFVKEGNGRSRGIRASRSTSADNPRASLLSVLSKRAFSCSGAPPVLESTCATRFFYLRFAHVVLA